MIYITRVLVLVAFLFVGVSSLQAQLVTSNADSGPNTLREAVDGAADGDAITFQPGLGQIDLLSEIIIDDAITITGDATSSTAITGSGTNRIFNIMGAGTVAINNVDLSNGSAVTGGAILVDSGSTLNLTLSSIANSEATGAMASEGGGAIYNDGGTVTLNTVDLTDNSASGASGSGGAVFNINGGTFSATTGTFSGNSSNRAGGAIEDNSSSAAGTIALNGVILDNNATGSAPGNGGAIHITGPGTVDITDGEITNNVATNEGGGLWNGSGTMTVTGTLIDNNEAQGDLVADPLEIKGGGGIFGNNDGTVVLGAGTTISNNTATGTQGSGGGVLMAVGSTLMASGTAADPIVISGNAASRAGGGLEDWSLGDTTNTITGVDFTNNTVGVDSGTFTADGGPGNGGAIHVTGPGNNNISGGSASLNIAAAEGGGFWNNSGTMTVDGTTLDQNTASGDEVTNGGGGLFNIGGTLTITGATISGNVADGAAGSGGGILNVNGGTLSVTGTAITGNTSNRAGGGIEDNSTQMDGAGMTLVGSVTLMNVNLDNNTTGDAPGNGGGMHLTGAANSSITGGTVSGNIASFEGGGLWNGSGMMTIDGTTIDGNEAQGDLDTSTTPATIVGGGGIFANDGAGSVTIEAGTIISNNTATGTQGSGGGILMATGTTLTINGTDGSPVVISGNSASRAGGGIEDWSLGGSPDVANVITNVNFMNNTAGVDVMGGFTADGGPGNGGAIHVTGPGDNTITGGTASGNIAAAEGGAFWNNAGTMMIDGTTITANDAQGMDVTNGGGGVFNIGGTLTINNADINTNTASAGSGSGGGILNVNGGTLSVTDTSITANSSQRAGGGIEDNSTIDDGTGSPLVGSITLSGVTLNMNSTGASPGNGGGMHLTGGANSTITGGTVSGNTAAQEGAGLWNGSGMMSIDGTEIDGNTASGAMAANGGGGIFNLGGTLTVANATISNNVADGASGSGGGILNTRGGDVTVSDSSITGNTSNRAGGGIEDNSTIMVDGATPVGSITLTDVSLDGNMTGDAPGNGGGMHLTGAANATITGGTVSGNTASLEGGGLWNGSGMMTITGTTIDGNDAQGDLDTSTTPATIIGGGGIFANDGAGSVTIEAGTTISNNIASGTQGSGGGILMATGTTLTINGTDGSPVVISGNSASRAGGGIEDWSLGGSPDVANVITNVNFMNNTAGVDVMGGFTADGGPGNGGAIHVTGPGDNTITGGTASGNIAAAEGGAFWNNAGTMSVDGVTLNQNIASGAEATNGGGALFNIGGTLNVTNATITANMADGTAGSGGGILNVNGGTLIVSDTEISGNSAVRAGGGIEDNSTVDDGSGSPLVGSVALTNIDLSSNTAGAAPGNGGGLHLTGGANSSVVTSTVNNNTAAAEGGGLWNGSGTMTITDTTIDGNTANGADADNGGGGIFNNGGGIINLNRSTVSNNTTTGGGSGGGIFNNVGTTITILASTISGNTTAGNGGGLFNDGDNATLVGATVANNEATGNGGGISAMSIVNITSTIVGINTAATGPSVDGAINSGGSNIVADDSSNSFTPDSSDQEGVDPTLADLADNGGPTFTHRLLFNSPAVNNGDDGSGNATDQRGEAVADGTRDVGAFEEQDPLSTEDFESPLSNTVIFPNPSSNGLVSLDIPAQVQGEVNINVVDITGKRVHTQQATSGRVDLNFSKLAVGTYIIQLNDGENTNTLKLIIGR